MTANIILNGVEYTVKPNIQAWNVGEGENIWDWTASLIDVNTGAKIASCGGCNDLQEYIPSTVEEIVASCGYVNLHMC